MVTALPRLPDCPSCHGAGIARPFNEIHSGYDSSIYDASGVKYASAYTVSIDGITLSDNLLAINFSASDTAVLPEVLVSFYGWDSKQFIVASHTSDSSLRCLDRRGNPGGCRMKYLPESSGGSANPLFTEDPASMPGSWQVTLDMADYVPTVVLPKDIPILIANGPFFLATDQFRGGLPLWQNGARRFRLSGRAKKLYVDVRMRAG